MAYWLLKTEPSEYSADDLKREKRTTWDGVANAAALKHMSAMKRDDTAIIYHTGDERACVALAQVAAAPNVSDPKAVTVDLSFKSMLPSPVTLATIKTDKAFEGWDLLRIGRLSVVPTSDQMFDRVVALATSKKEG